jgi:hypothetical protein
MCASRSFTARWSGFFFSGDWAIGFSNAAPLSPRSFLLTARPQIQLHNGVFQENSGG